MKKIMRSLLLILALGLFITGCSSEPKVPLQQQAMNYFELFGRLDGSKLDEMFIDLTQEEYEEEIKVMEDEVRGLAVETFGDMIPEEKANEYVNAILNSLKRAETQIEILEETSKTATVKYTIKSVDLNKVIEDCLKDVETVTLAKIEEDPTLLEDDSKLYIVLVDYMIGKFNEAQLSSEQTCEVAFEKVLNVWTVTSEEEVLEISKAVGLQ